MIEETERSIPRALMNAGRAQERVSLLLDQDCFNGLSKHDPKFHSEHEREGDILYHLRGNLNYIQEELYAIHAILRNDD